MADFTLIRTQYNTNTDASPTWSGTALSFGGSAGANEVRFVNSGLGAGGSTSSASWPLVTKPASGTATFAQAWAFTADTTGTQIATYTGDNTKARVLRIDWDNTGTFASSPQFSCFDSTSHNAPSAGTQPSIVNGSSDTSNTSYAKINAYGNGVTAGGTQHTPSAGSVGSNPSATTGGAGAVSPAATPAWLTTWSAAAGWVDYIVDGVTPQATTAGDWYISIILFYGANISAATYTFTLTFQYTFS
jgi:hypothetical protein